MSDDRFLVFTVQAYQSKAPDGTLIDMCSLELICKSADEAIKRAEKIITKDYYRIARVFENYHVKP